MSPFLPRNVQRNNIYFVYLFLLLDLFFCQLQQKLNQIQNKPHLKSKLSALSMQEERAGARRFYKFFKKKIIVQEIIDLNISWPSNFFRKYFMAPPIYFCFLFKAYLKHYLRVVLTVIFKFQINKEVNIHNNIQKVIFK